MFLLNYHWLGKLSKPTIRVFGVALLCLIITIETSQSQNRRIAVVRDAEIENLVRDYARPILKVAGLSNRGIEIILVNDLRFNAFVSGRRIFINLGAILKSETPNELIGIIAHEIGHLAGNHQERLRAQMEATNTLAMIGVLFGAGAAIAGSATGNSDGGSAAGAAILTATPSVARRSLLSYRRTEEMNADQAAAKYLKATKQSAKGLLTTFERLGQGLALAGVGGVDPYRQSHPLPRERVALLNELANASPYFSKLDSKNLQARHDNARAKIAAFKGGAQMVARQFSKQRNSFAARYGNAISVDLAGRSKEALKRIDQLLKQQPNNPYLWEFRGEILLKLRQADKASQSFAKALKLDKNNSGLISARLGMAYNATANPKYAKRAIEVLRAGIQSEPDNLNAYDLLSRAYALDGNIGAAELAMAEGHFRAGNTRQAKIFAGRAAQKLAKGQPNWRRANDILTLGNN